MEELTGGFGGTQEALEGFLKPAVQTPLYTSCFSSCSPSWTTGHCGKLPSKCHGTHCSQGEANWSHLTHASCLAPTCCHTCQGACPHHLHLQVDPLRSSILLSVPWTTNLALSSRLFFWSWMPSYLIHPLFTLSTNMDGHAARITLFQGCIC